MNYMTRSKLADTMNTTHAIVLLAKQERATSGFDTLVESKAKLEQALAARTKAADALAAYDAE